MHPRTSILCLALLIVAVLGTGAPAEAAPRTFTVTTTADRPDTLQGNGICAISGGGCSLRAAIDESNANAGADTIELPAGVYELEIPTLNEDLPGTGDLDITDGVTINGVGAGVSIIDGGFPLPGAGPEQRGLDRIFEIHRGAGNVTLSGVTLREGYAEEDGGAIQNWSTATLRLEDSEVLDSNAGKAGGGINNADPSLYPCEICPSVPPMSIPGGRVELIGTRVSGNAASEGGAGINNASTGTVAILAGSQITRNPGEMIPDPAQVIDPLDPDPVRFVAGPGVYDPGQPAVENQAEGGAAGTIRIADSTVSDNYATSNGAGVYNAGSGALSIERSHFARNTTEASGAAVYAVGGKVSVSDSTFSGNTAHADAGAFFSGGDTSDAGLRSRVSIEGSTFEANEAWAGGGAIYNDGESELTLTALTVEDNEAHDAGGGLVTLGRATLALSDSSFTGNAAHGEGGAVYTASERPVSLAGSEFNENSAGVPGLEGHDAGGGAIYTEGGPLDLRDSTLSDNTATAEGGGLSIDNHGDVTVSDTLVRRNTTPMSGGGIENSGREVTFTRVTAANNRATEDGGGIHNSSSGEFQVIDSTMKENRASNGGGFTNASDSTLIMRGSLIWRNTAKRVFNAEDPEHGGLGGGFYSISDGGGKMENTTVSTNSANVRGGGMFHDADASFTIANTTIWRNSAPFGGGISTVESDFVPSIPPQPNPLTLRNTIVGGSLQGGSCDAMLTSHGGNLDSGTGCMLRGERDRGNSDPELDAIADNGGPTLTHWPNEDSLAVDWALDPCTDTDQRGVTRPQHLRCDAGAVEYDGPKGPPDTIPPDTEYLGGPIQDSLETNAFFFTGSDTASDGSRETPVSELAYECRLVEHDLTEEPEIIAPWDPIEVELLFVSCQNGWQTKLVEEGLYDFEVRAIDRYGNVDPTPAIHTFNGTDTSPPDTVFVDTPAQNSTTRAATFTFEGIDNGTPSKFMEYECRLDSRDPDMWLECFNPAFFSSLATGTHTFEVRATDANDNVDPTPARWTWTIGPPANCDQANVTLTASADAWVDEVNPQENYLFETELTVRSAASGGGTTGEPLVGENARTLVRFPIPTDAGACALESATLRLHSDGGEPRTLLATPLAAGFKESSATWINQPATIPGVVPAGTESGEGYREWDVLEHVEAMVELGQSHGWQIRDAQESDTDLGGESSFASRETPQDPPETTLPELVLRYEAAGGTAPDPPAEPAGPARTVSCGDVIRESTTIANDLLDCPGEGLVIGAPNIVLDLDGHTIDGPDYLLENVVGGQEEGFPAGIRNSGHTNVVIRNGTVQQFGWGVLLTGGTTHNLLEDLTILRNATAGVEFFDADDGRSGNTLRGSRIADNELGVHLVAGAENSRIVDNDIEGNLGEQILVMFASGHRIEGNRMHGIPSDPLLDSDGGVLLWGASDNELVDNTARDTGDAGVMLAAGSNRNLVQGGLYRRNGDAGVIIEDSDRNQVIGIRSHVQSDGGVVLNNAHHTVVRGNDLRFNPSGVEASDTNALVLEGNDASHSLQAGLGVGNGRDVRIVNNVVKQAGGAGISLEASEFDAGGAPIHPALISGNRTDENRDDGITVADGGHTIRGNLAHNNAGYGIRAGETPVPGEPNPNTNIDGGGNEATGNAEPEQCVGVLCRTVGSVPRVGEDLTAPQTAIDVHPGALTHNTSVTFAFSGTDNLTVPAAIEFECRLDPGPDPLPDPPDPEPPSPNEPPEPPDTPPDGEGWVECASPMTFHDVDEGPHHFQVRAIDFAGNKDLSPAEHRWVSEPLPEEPEGPDSTAPDTRITAMPDNPSHSSTATFRFNGTDNLTPGPDLTYECRIDADAFTPCASPKVYEDLQPGPHAFEVRAVDRTGNADGTPATFNWLYEIAPGDTVAPDTVIESGPDKTTVRTAATFELTSDEAGATFECSLNGASYAPCASPHELTGLGVRTHELLVRARDAAGNADPTPAVYQWTVGAAPVSTFVSCGQVITRSIIVRNGLTDCLFDGLVVGANGITIDLDGHTIDGKGLGAGIRNDGFDSVTIRNGKAIDFDHGVALNTDTTQTIVEGMTLEQNQESGIALGLPPQQDPTLPVDPPDPIASSQSKVAGNILRGNTSIGNNRGIWLTNATKDTLVRGNSLVSTASDGIFLERTTGNRVEDNEISVSSGAGVALEGASENVIAGNELTDNTNGVTVDITRAVPTGLPSDDNRIERNTMDESGGLEVIESSRNHLIENTVLRATEPGVSLEYALDNVVRGNDVRGNKGGITLKASAGNRIEDNDASQSEGTGIALESLSLSNTLLKNTSNGNDGDGIYVGDETPGGSGTLVQGNETNNNIGHGIRVTKVSHVIKGNLANDNGSWGIWVSEGSNGRVNVDAGGNRASGNIGPLDPQTLLPQQCYVVRCEGGAQQSSDRIAPETSIIEGPAEITTQDYARFRFTGTDNASGVEYQCSLDEAAFAPCESPATYEGLAAGAHTFSVRAVDISGNVDSSPPTYEWWIGERPDGEPPVTTIDSGPHAATASGEATFRFSADVRGSTFECALDAGDYAPCEWSSLVVLTDAVAQGSASYAGLAVGTHTFSVRATDPQGNTSEPAAWTWRVTAAPVPTQIECGDIVTQSILVSNDLLDCGGNGLVIGANDVTVDLDGHVIDGIGLDAAILNTGHDGVTVTNGHLHEFDYGVLLNPGSSQNLLTGLRVELNQEAGIALADADQDGLGNTVRDNDVVANGMGIALYSGTRHADVRGNHLGANQADGVRMEFASDNRVSGNEIANSGGAGVVMEGGGSNIVAGNTLKSNHGSGVAVGEELLPSNGARVEHNTIEDSGGPGIGVIDSDGARVLFNDVKRSNGAGAVIELASDTLLRGNDLGGNAGGIELSEASGNRIESNNAGESLGTGISLEANSLNNDIVLNAASGNNGEGIEIADSAPSGQGNLLEGNTADSNGGDGISAAGAGHTLTANRASLNGGWGIYAPLGAIDGGNNFAAGNAEPGQCLGIECIHGEVPGAPDTKLVSTPPAVSNSRNASFTYTATDDVTELVNMVFECRLDSTDPLAWEDCEYPHEYLNLSAGEHTFEIRAVDQNLLADPTPASYTWTYEPLPSGRGPEVTIEMKPDAETWLVDSIFTFRADEPDVTFECRVDLWAYEPCGFESANFMNRGAFEWGLEETEVGLHTFSVRAIDFEGNRGPAATYTWRLLGVVTEFLSGPGFTPGTEGEPATGGETQGNTATIDFRANVSDATYLCSLDLEPFEPCTPPVTYTGLHAPGEHQLRVISIDANGVEELEPAVYEWEILDPADNAPPETTIERAPLTGTSSTFFEFAGTDDFTIPARLRFECRVDSTSNADWFECQSPYSLLETYVYEDPQLAPGEHTFEVRAVDDFEPLVPDPQNPNFEGNPDPTPATYTWTSVEDTTPPGTAIVAGPAARTTEPSAAFEFAGSDNATPGEQLTFECSLDGAPFEPCSSPEDVSPATPGEHTLRVRTVDVAGNADPTPAARTWTIVPAPVVTITSGPVDGETSDSVTFAFTADQPGSTFECSFDGASFAPCSSPHTQQVPTEGGHTLEVRAVNPEGMVSEEPAVHEWLAAIGPDGTRPDTTITATPPASTMDQIATFEFTGTDNRTLAVDLAFECSLDGAAFEGCESPHELADLTRGEHTLRVRAIDAVQLADASPAEYTWRVVPPPATTILTGPEDPSEDSSPTFTFESDVPGSTFECWLDGPKGPCTSPVTYENIAPGPHIFAVRATDPAGNTNPVWTEYEWEIGDVAPPLTTITSGPQQPTTENTRAEFTFTADELGVTFQCALDGGPMQPCTSPRVYPRLHPGVHTFEVQALPKPILGPDGEPIDLPDPVSTFYEWEVVDLTAPDTTIDFGPRDTTASTTAIFGVGSDDPTAVIECSLDGEAFSECEQPIEYTELERGPHTLQVRAVDLAGNADPTPATHAWTITEPGAPNTPVGSNVTVVIPMPDGPGNASVNFAEVAMTGSTTVEQLAGAAPLPAGYSAGGARFYDVSTTSPDYGEPVNLCLAYDPADYSTTAVRLLSLDGGQWLDITLTNDPFNGRLCGEIEQFGTFAIATATPGLAPLVSIISGPAPVSTSTSATFTFVSDMADSQVQCSLDGAPFAACESPVTYTHLEEGGHDFQVQAIGASGIPSAQPTLYEWEVVPGPDTEAPETTITRGPGAMTSNYITRFEFTGTDDRTAAIELEFECSLDGGPFESCDVPEEVEVTTAGQHRLEVRAVDAAGNIDPSPAVRTWTVVDLSSPDTSIDAGPDSETEATTATFEFTGEEPDGTPVTQFECALDGAEFTACSTPHTVSGLSAGPHVMQVRAKDPRGNVDPSPDFLEWLIIGPLDGEAPDTTIVASPTSPSSPDVLFGFASDELVETFQCSLDGAPFQDCESPYELTGLSAGEHTLRVRAVDLLLNVDPTPASHTWTSAGVPDTVIESRPTDPSPSQSATFTFSSQEEGVTFQCSVDGSEFVPCTSPFVAGPLAGNSIDGEQHEFEVRAVSPHFDLEGLRIVDETPARYDWTVLLDPEPAAFDTHITAAPAGTVAGGEDAIYLFNFTANDIRAAFECSMDGEPFEDCTPPVEYTGSELGPGEHTFRVRSIDPAEQPDATPASHTFTIEAPAETALLSGPPATTDATDATFTFSTDRAGYTFECSLDLAPFTPCLSGVSYANVPYGEHEFQVRAVSPAGTADATPATHEWASGHLTAPVGQILTGPASLTTDTTAVFTFSSNDPAATFLCSLDGGIPLPCSSPKTYTDLLPGADHTLSVVPTKPNLLVDAEPLLWEWTVGDVAAPATSIDSGPPAATIATDATIAFSATDNTPAETLTYECSLDGAPFSSCDSPVELSGLELGEHTLAVQASDVSGNTDASPATHTWTVADATTIDSGPAALSDSADATFTFSSFVAGVPIQCSLDGAPFAACSSPLALTGLADGEHVLEVRAGTGVPNVWDETPASYEWTIATPVAPDTTIDVAPDEITNLTSALFEFSSGTPDVTYECSLDGAAFGPCISGVEYTALSGGLHRFEVRAVDAGGSADRSPAVHEWTVDLPAETTILSGPPASTVSTIAQFEFESNEPDATFECSRDGGASWGSCDASTQYTDVAVGDHELLVRAEDAFGNVDATPAVHRWTVRPLPDTTIDSGPDEATEDRSATFAFSSDQAGATFECRLDDAAAFTPCASPKTYTDLAVEEHDLLVRAVDADGNPDPTPAEYSWEIGEVPPPVTITSGPAATTESTSATFEFAAPEPDLTYECSLDGAAFSQCASPKTYSGLALGEHTLRVQVFSPTSIVEQVPDTHTWAVVDLTAPNTAIELAPASVTGSATATFAFSSEAGATFECSLDGGGYAPCDSPHQLTGLALGDHTLEVRAVDAAGNADGTPERHEWTVVAPPDTLLDPATEPEPGVTSLTLTFSSDQAGTSFECSLDFGPWSTCSSPHTLSGLSDGDHSVEVRAKSTHGVLDPDPALFEFTVETPPDTTIASGPAALTASGSANFTFAANEPDVTYECSLDGAAFAECTSPHGYDGLADGQHELRVRATDASSSVDATPATWSWTVDSTAPQTTIPSGPAATTTTTSATFTLAASEAGSVFECSLDGAAFAACASPKEYTGLALGAHELRVRATDAAGNTDATPATHAWTVSLPDCTAAPVTLTPNADGWVDQGSPAANKGADSVLKVMSKGPAHNVRALVRFANPNLPANCGVATARLRMFAASTSGTRTLQALRVTGAWTEGGVTWANQPATTGPDATVASGAGWREWTVTSQLRAMYAAGANHGFLVRDASENADAEQQFRSRESAVDRPQLVITWGNRDTTAPQTTIDSGPAATTQSRSATLQFSSNEAGSAFECSLDGAAFAACASPKDYTSLSLGAHEVRVRAVDESGNTDATPATHSWTVEPDTTAPETTLASGGPAATTSNTSATFNFSSDEPGVTFECSLDAGAFTACTSPKAYSGLAVGNHEFRVRARDAAGNADPSPASHSWTIVAPTCVAGSATAGADRDSWMLQSSSGSNFGGDSVLKVNSKSGNGNSRALVRFGLPSVPSGCQVTSARLRLYAGSYVSGRTLQALRVNATWTETAVTWANQPATTGSAATAPSRSSAGYVEWTVTGQVQSMYSGANHGFLIRDASENGGGFEQGFHSREKAPDNPPQLVVTFGP